MKIKKRRSKRSHFSRYIEGTPLRITKDKSSVREIFCETANDKFLVFDNTDKPLFRWMGIFFYIVALFTPFLPKGDRLIGFLSSVLLGSYIILYAYKGPRSEVILDRQKGLITFPYFDFFWGKPATLSFKDAIITWSIKTAGVSGGSPKLTIIDPNGWTSTVIAYTEILETWSLMVWYMDKNRPLPLGDAFDEYRQQDFERRKAEGFPPPLYPSAIPTPEATAKQQAERKRIGGW